jgi:hypothetical protein
MLKSDLQEAFARISYAYDIVRKMSEKDPKNNMLKEVRHKLADCHYEYQLAVQKYGHKLKLPEIRE